MVIFNAESNMKFVHIEDFFHPDAGYQLNLLSVSQVRQGHEVFIITSLLDKVPDSLTSFFSKENIKEKDQSFTKNTGVKIIRLPIHKYYSGRAIFHRGFIKRIKIESPDVLFVHGNDTLTAMRILFNFKSINLPIVMDNHMLEMATTNRFSAIFRIIYRNIFTPLIRKYKIPIIKIVDSDFIDKNYNIPFFLIKRSSFGTDPIHFSPNPQNKEVMRQKYNINMDDFVVLYAGKMDESKGGLFLANAIKQKIELNDRNIVFVIIGNTTKDDYGEMVESTFKSSENKIIRIPTQTYRNLSNFYQMADIAFFPKQCSMSYFEVQSCGLPVVIEKNEINLERVSNEKGLLFNEGSIEDLTTAIVRFGNMEKKLFQTFCNNSRENIVKNYNYENVALEFTNIMKDKYNEFYSQTQLSKKTSKE